MTMLPGLCPQIPHTITSVFASPRRAGPTCRGGEFEPRLPTRQGIVIRNDQNHKGRNVMSMSETAAASTGVQTECSTARVEPLLFRHREALVVDPRMASTTTCQTTMASDWTPDD